VPGLGAMHHVKPLQFQRVGDAAREKNIGVNQQNLGVGDGRTQFHRGVSRVPGSGLPACPVSASWDCDAPGVGALGWLVSMASSFSRSTTATVSAPAVTDPVT